MITIIHGSDTAASRKYFNDQKQQHPASVHLEADEVTITDLTQILESGGLFGESKVIFIEQLLTKKKRSADLKGIATYLSGKADENTIILWEGKELEAASLKLFKKATPRIFKLPQTLFQLLDAMKPQNTSQILSLFHKTIETTEVEMVFFMLIRHFRLLLALSDANDNEQIDDIKRMQDWQKTKLKRQATFFTATQLLKNYQQLYKLEVGQKTGTLTSSLTTAIDFFLLEV